MLAFVSIVHALTCVFIVLFILLQDPKGGVLGSLGGGTGGKSFFGSEGASPFLVKVTKWLAVIFACSSFYLSYISSQNESRLMAPDQVEQGPNANSQDASQNQTPSANKQEASQNQAPNTGKTTNNPNQPNTGTKPSNQPTNTKPQKPPTNPTNTKP